MSTLPLETTCATAPALDEEALAWLALALAPGLGPKRILDAVKRSGFRQPDIYPAADRA